MATNTISVAKSGLKSAIIEALYNEILTNTNNYYYFLGRTLEWNNTDTTEIPQIDLAYESQVRSEIILLKKITSADVSYVIPRYDWSEGQVFDMYDDKIGRITPLASAEYSGGNIYIDCNDHGFVVGDTVKITGINPVGYNGKFVITYVEPNRFAFASAQNPGIYVSGGNITRCSTLGFESLDESKFYCMTSEFHVYKCLNNNDGAPSTVKPYSTTAGRLTLSDGYTWKYMYTVPVASRNKFMGAGDVSADIPVVTAIKAPYYSRGSINSVTVNSYGDGYVQDTARLSVAGNGYLEDNPIRVLNVNINARGSGYLATPVASADDPFESEPFETETAVLPGVYLKAGNHIYRTISAGVTGTVNPTYTGTDVIYSGTVALRYAGTSVSIDVTMEDGEVTDVELLGMLGYIELTNPGSGYTSIPNVSITGDGSGATASCNITDGRVTNITITSRGEDYTTMGVVFDDPVTADAAWSSEGTVALDDIISRSDNFYRVTNVDAGTTLGTIAPTHTSGAVMNGDVELTFIAAKAKGTADIYYGYGYSFTPTIFISPSTLLPSTNWESGITVELNEIIFHRGNFYTVTNVDAGTSLGTVPPAHTIGAEMNGDVELTFFSKNAELSAVTQKTEAILTPIVENGQIVAVIVVDGGIGYSSAVIQAIGSTDEAVLTPNLSYGDLNTNQANIELLAIPGTIDAIKVTNPGSGYTSSSALVTIEGDGTGATAEAVVQNDRLVRVNVTNVGSGYTFANVVISDPDIGTNVAKARAIVSPVEGHGKDAVAELCASDISLFSSISGELNQGFSVLNDYRQIGIIKNPQQFATNKRLNTSLGSTCYGVNLLYPDNDGSNIALDDELLDADGNRFRVVARETGTNSCSLLLQSIDNAELQLTQNLFFGLDILTIDNIVEPTANKYTGNLLFIDNRNAFIPNIEQTIAIRTAIRF